MSSPRATIGILSLGQMGAGIARLLQAHNYRVLTNVSDRSPATQSRAKEAGIGLVDKDAELVEKCDYVLSIVPPRDAVATANRITHVFENNPKARQSSSSPLYYLELNAIAPSTAVTISDAFAKKTPTIRFIDGGIIGGPPSPNSDNTWKRPEIPLSGPFPLHEAPSSGSHLAETMNTEHLGPKPGSASGLKCCFAALSKGFTALAIQSFSTAASLDVLPALQRYLEQFNPGAGEKANKSIVGCVPKAYRWVEEMNQIGLCFEEEGGWREQARVFRQIAGVYQGMADVVEQRGETGGMGTTDEVVDALGEGLRKD